MTKDELWNLTKTVLVIVYGILGLLAAFGPLAQYREYLLLAAGIVSIIAGTLGAQLTKPTEQIHAIKVRKSGVHQISK